MARFNDYWTEEDQRAEDLEGKKDYWEGEARQSYYEDVERIAQKVEHLIDNDDLTVEINHVVDVAEAMDKIAEISMNYIFHDDYQFDYDFTEEGKAFLTDHFGYTGE